MKEPNMSAALNIGGAFLPFQVTNVLRKRGWEVLVEYPVKVVPFHTEPEIPESREYRSDFEIERRAIASALMPAVAEETSADIVATKDFKHSTITLCVEVKKRSPQYRTWLFLGRSEEKTRSLCLTISPEEGIPLIKIPKTLQIQNELHLMWSEKVRTLFPKPIRVFEYARGIMPTHGENQETHERISEKERQKTLKTDQGEVDRACRQCCLATYAVVLDKLDEILRSRAFPSVPHFFLPVVVTTADLVTCEFEVDDVDLKTGEIDPAKPEYEKSGWVVYEYSTPQSVRFPISKERWLQDLEVRHRSGKWHVPIVHTEYFDSLLDRFEQVWRIP